MLEPGGRWVLVSPYAAENCIVVAEGALQHNGVFRVDALGFPPPETRAESQAALKVRVLGILMSMLAGMDHEAHQQRACRALQHCFHTNTALLSCLRVHITAFPGE